MPGNQERNRPRPKYPRTNSTIKTTMMIPSIRLSFQEWYPEAGRMEPVDGAFGATSVGWPAKTCLGQSRLAGFEDYERGQPAAAMPPLDGSTIRCSTYMRPGSSGSRGTSTSAPVPPPG